MFFSVKVYEIKVYEITNYIYYRQLHRYVHILCDTMILRIRRRRCGGDNGSLERDQRLSVVRWLAVIN